VGRLSDESDFCLKHWGLPPAGDGLPPRRHWRRPRTNGYRARAVKDVHIVVGILAVVLNVAAFGLGAVAWLRRRPSPWFWRALRGGQAVVALEAAIGGVLLLAGEKATNLHYLYGALPLIVGLIAEQLRLSAATMVLDAHQLEDAAAVGRLPPAQQRQIVAEIIRREIGSMTLAALVVVVLLARAATVY
jgi:hypothetical protein